VWRNRWDHSKRFEAAGHTEIDCDGAEQTASCCSECRDPYARGGATNDLLWRNGDWSVCKSIVGEIETQLDNTPVGCGDPA
jgi:hypothetical protein